MKKALLLLAVSLGLFACGNNNESQAPTATQAKTDLSANPDYQKGVDLVAKSDCLTCHKISEKLIGPSYKDVANKYAGQADAVAKLADKVMKGGTGVWGDVPMAAHPNLSKEDAEAMIKYVLLLKD